MSVTEASDALQRHGVVVTEIDLCIRNYPNVYRTLNVFIAVPSVDVYRMGYSLLDIIRVVLGGVAIVDWYQVQKSQV